MSSTQPEADTSKTNIYLTPTEGDVNHDNEGQVSTSGTSSSTSNNDAKTENLFGDEHSTSQSLDLNGASPTHNDEDPFIDESTHITPSTYSLPTPPPQPPAKDTTSTTKPYSTWTKAELAQGIAETKAKITELQNERHDEFERLRLDIERVKEKLRALGADPDPPRTPGRKGRKRVVESEGEDEDGTYGSQRKKGKRGRKGGRKKRNNETLAEIETQYSVSKKEDGGDILLETEPQYGGSEKDVVDAQ